MVIDSLNHLLDKWLRRERERMLYVDNRCASSRIYYPVFASSRTEWQVDEHICLFPYMCDQFFFLSDVDLWLPSCLAYKSHSALLFRLNLQMALTQLEGVAQMLNERKRESDLRLAVKCIADSLTGNSKLTRSLPLTNRCLVRVDNVRQLDYQYQPLVGEWLNISTVEPRSNGFQRIIKFSCYKRISVIANKRNQFNGTKNLHLLQTEFRWWRVR